MTIAAKITGTGSAFPPGKVTNSYLSTKLAELGVETNDQWIRERTGICERRYSETSKSNGPSATLATQAALRALEMAGKDPLDIDQIIVATCSPDTMIPSTACWLQEKIGAKNAWAMDINAACTGFIYGLTTVAQFIKTGQTKTALVVGSEVLHPFMDWQDRSSCILFGDAAGAVIVEAAPDDSKQRIVSWHLSSDGKFGDLLNIPTPEQPAFCCDNKSGANGSKIVMNGREIFKVAVRTLTGIAETALSSNGITIDKVDWFIPHQANLRILEAVAHRLKLPPERVLINVDRYGNTSAATIPTVLDEAVRDGRIKEGQLLLLDAFGAGFTYGAMLIQW
jgi:3-oxoacyl-[acyl-carrier-protein] synthase-3